MSAIARSKQVYSDVPGDPVKSFFVEMLTRDITLTDSILDLIDNCIDGILRSSNKGNLRKKKPYSKYSANIKFDGEMFEITDNCGGIPWAVHEYAFRMGRTGPTRDENIPTVGVYGIGMKRAIFKIGKHALIQTQHKKDAYDVEILPTWLSNESNWSIPVRESNSSMDADGTTIIVSDLNPGIKDFFDSDRASFEGDLISKVSTHFAFIINKGFSITINGKNVAPKPTELRFDTSNRKKHIRPFIYQDSVDGVDVFLAVGFTSPIPSLEEVEKEHEHKKYSSVDAGWTVVCNDRAVLYCDRTELTGWGEAGVPKYHTQFIAISGVVEFRSNDSSKLPTTTTKRGIDASSRLYLRVKNKMREGLAMFTDFTNKWKGVDKSREAQKLIESAKPMSLTEIKAATVQKKVTLRKLAGNTTATQFKPKLPMPQPSQSKDRRISFVRPIKEIEDISDYLFSDSDVEPSRVGEKCFERILGEAKK